MEKEFVTYEIALKLKNLGFAEQCFGKYVENSVVGYPTLDIYQEEKNTMSSGSKSIYVCSAPIWQQVQRWLLEQHNIHITITSRSQESWQWHIQFPHDTLDTLWEDDFSTYMEALEYGINRALDLCSV